MQYLPSTWYAPGILQMLSNLFNFIQNFSPGYGIGYSAYVSLPSIFSLSEYTIFPDLLLKRSELGFIWCSSCKFPEDERQWPRGWDVYIPDSDADSPSFLFVMRQSLKLSVTISTTVQVGNGVGLDWGLLLASACFRKITWRQGCMSRDPWQHLRFIGRKLFCRQNKILCIKRKMLT